MNKLDPDQATPYFTRKELICRCGCGTINLDVQAVTVLDIFRGYLGRPIIIESACRCRGHNARIGGAPASFHIADHKTQTRAFDIRSPGMTPAELMQEIEAFDLGGVITGRGVYPDQEIIHIDTGPREHVARWIKHKNKPYQYVEAFVK